MPTGATVDDYCLWYGSGYHPIQWITSGFLHANAAHLIGNMFFLWPFGLLVEGKLGWWKFLILYLAILVGQNALEQTIMLGADSSVNTAEVMDQFSQNPEFAAMNEEEREFFRQLLQLETADEIRRSLGASAVIFGLLAICILWAPASDFCIWWRFGTFDLPVLVVGGAYVLFEIWKWQSGDFSIGSAALHLMGMVTGLIGGVIFLKTWTGRVRRRRFCSIYCSVNRLPGLGRIRPRNQTKNPTQIKPPNWIWPKRRQNANAMTPPKQRYSRQPQRLRRTIHHWMRQASLPKPPIPVMWFWPPRRSAASRKSRR